MDVMHLLTLPRIEGVKEIWMLPVVILHAALSMGLPTVVDDLARPIGSQSDMDWTKARFAVGDVIADDVDLHTGFPGLDLPDLKGREAYVRGNENVYRVDKKTMKVLEVVPIGSVLLY